MRKQILIFFIFLGTFAVVQAQSPIDTTKKKTSIWATDHYIDLSAGLGDRTVAASAQWDKLFGIAKNRIKLGFGVRMNVANLWDKSYFTAPPQRNTGIFDTLVVDHQTLYYCNLTFILDVSLLKWWDVGMNIDIVGASWGPASEATYYSHNAGYNKTRETVTPETLNLMLFGHNDFGNLNSQFYMRFWPSSNVYIKAGMSLNTFISHTGNTLNNGNTRFNSGCYMGFLSLGWTPKRSEWKSAGGNGVSTHHNPDF